LKKKKFEKQKKKTGSILVLYRGENMLKREGGRLAHFFKT